MYSTLTTRFATLEDVDAMYGLDLLCFSEAFRFNLQDMWRLVSDPKGIAVVAEVDGAIIGFGIVSLKRRRGEMLAYLATLDVHPSHRRQGLARRLMSGLERGCVISGSRRLTLHVSTENSGAISFYETSGYVRLGLIADYYGAAGDAWMYRKLLES